MCEWEWIFNTWNDQERLKSCTRNAICCMDSRLIWEMINVLRVRLFASGHIEGILVPCTFFTWSLLLGFYPRALWMSYNSCPKPFFLFCRLIISMCTPLGRLYAEVSRDFWRNVTTIGNRCIKSFSLDRRSFALSLWRMSLYPMIIISSMS